MKVLIALVALVAVASAVYPRVRSHVKPVTTYHNKVVVNRVPTVDYRKVHGYRTVQVPTVDYVPVRGYRTVSNVVSVPTTRYAVRRTVVDGYGYGAGYGYRAGYDAGYNGYGYDSYGKY
ncbi:uncharacterized protein LOC106178280 [Lingula anatina]|uniref:Uncharacterized protein LOC106178280 n=1 Tax=Lingula anatina TaxID=7574 RepID=A0A1S3K2V5_LINAN|nr:uncharacterized protein LOC106178280 [Lingula anatina]|eukprot:XP_013416857.1 uncharacterized protein LOC106178280 [Lingula anatina]